MGVRTASAEADRSIRFRIRFSSYSPILVLRGSNMKPRFPSESRLCAAKSMPPNGHGVFAIGSDPLTHDGTSLAGRHRTLSFDGTARIPSSSRAGGRLIPCSHSGR